MQRYAIWCALVVAACGTTDDERPRNLDYVTEAILAPSCGSAECHSTFRQADGFVFDTVEGARHTFANDVKLIGYAEGDITMTPGLYLNLTIEQPKAPRMPYTYPLPDADIALISEWLKKGAPGVCTTGTLGCIEGYVVRCVDVQTSSKPLVFEKGAYDLEDVAAAYSGGGNLRDCTKEGLRCVAGDCK